MDQWDRGPRSLITALLVSSALLGAGYWAALPVLVSTVVRHVPPEALDAIGSQVLASLDADVFAPSALPPARQEALRAAFARLPMPRDVADRARLMFRQSAAIGANALALPSGVVIVTDELVALARDSDDVVAVLAHEAGHLEGRHGIRAVVRGALLSGVLMLLVGDVSAMAAAAPAVLLNARYSRDLEREADAYAVAALGAVHISPTRLADMLERMEAQRAHTGEATSSRALSYLSTHPTTDERLRTLRRAP